MRLRRSSHFLNGYLCVRVQCAMAVYIVLLALCGVASSAPPSPPRLYQQHAQLQQINALDYYLDNPDMHAYYQQQQQKQGNQAASSNQPARLETLEPDSEVELIPGAQAPQQPPQQNPVAPNLPGLAPGQRVFIVHMPIPGYRPGTIGGYQPVYIVAAAPQGNPQFPGNGYQNPGYQNTLYLDPSSGQVISPLGYPRGVVQQGANPGLLLGGSLLNRPFDLVYQDPNLAYQTGPVLSPDGNRGAVRLSQLVGLQGQSASRPASNEASQADQGQKSQAIVESKEASEEPRRRPTSAHAQTRTKA